MMPGVIDFVEKVIYQTHLSLGQKVILKSTYGEPLDGPGELEMYRTLTSLDEYIARERGEVTIVAGRGSGKSNELASNLAIYEAVGRKHTLSVGEIAAVMIISTEVKRQSRIEFNYILKKMEGSPLLKATIDSVTSDEIRLKNGCIIQVFPCNLARVRGASIQMCIADELGFWKAEGHSIDREVLEAVRPGLRLPHSKLIKISSPYAMRGELWYDFKHHFSVDNDDCLVFKAPTIILNPTFSQKRLDAAQRRDPVSFATEYGAAFRSDETGLLDPAVIDRAVNRDRPMELSYRGKMGPYYGFVDVSGGGGKDSYAMAIAHLEDEKIVIDVVRSRAPKPKFNPLAVTEEYCRLLKSYGVSSVEGDKFSGDMALNEYAKHMVDYKPAGKSKAEIYLEAEGIFNAGRIEIPDREVLIGQLSALVRKTRSGGRDSVDTDSGQPEDEANVICGVAVMIALAGGSPVFFGTIPNVLPFGSAGYVPDGDDDEGIRALELGARKFHKRR